MKLLKQADYIVYVIAKPSKYVQHVCFLGLLYRAFFKNRESHDRSFWALFFVEFVYNFFL